MLIIAKRSLALKLAKKSVDGDGDFYESLLQWRNTPNKIDISPAEKFFEKNPFYCAVFAERFYLWP